MINKMCINESNKTKQKNGDHKNMKKTVTLSIVFIFILIMLCACNGNAQNKPLSSDPVTDSNVSETEPMPSFDYNAFYEGVPDSDKISVIDLNDPKYKKYKKQIESQPGWSGNRYALSDEQLAIESGKLKMAGGNLSYQYDEKGNPIAISFTDPKRKTTVLIEGEDYYSYCQFEEKISETQFIYRYYDNMGYKSGFKMYDLSQKKAYDLEDDYDIRNSSIYIWYSEGYFYAENFIFYKMDLKTYEVEDYTHCIPSEVLDYLEYQYEGIYHPTFIITPDNDHVVLAYVNDNCSELFIDVYELIADAPAYNLISHNSIDRSEILNEQDEDWLLYTQPHISNENSIVMYTASWEGSSDDGEYILDNKAILIEF